MASLRIGVVLSMLGVVACGEVKPAFVDGGVDATADDAAVACADRACSGVADSCCPASCNANDDIDCAAVCGNGTLEPGERCDPLGSCPTACPADGCALFTLDQPGTCFAQCLPAGTQTVCQNGDGCCPAGCNANNDSECQPACDNGAVEPGERCDPLSSCPSACPQLGCQLRSLSEGGTCNAQCVDAGMQTACVDSDGCCPAGCNANDDSDCQPGCGNGVIEAGETCDPINTCPTACPALGCQLRSLSGGGTCAAACVDAGMQTACVNNDGCCPGACDANNDSDCQPECGNGVVEAGETCDPQAPAGQNCQCPAEAYTCFGPTGSPTTCDVVCHVPTTTCGAGGDRCCPYAGPAPREQDQPTAECSSARDPECPGDGWAWRYFGQADYRSQTSCRIVTVYPEIDEFGSYLITTCRPPGGQYQQGTGDSVIRSVRDDLGNTYEVANDDCADASALPQLAGWDCTNNAGVLRMSCASPSPGGFMPRGPIGRLEIEICPYNDQSAGSAPVFIWYNARIAPNPG